MKTFATWLESSLHDLFQSTIRGFPNTRRRQHVTGPLRITETKWTPFLGLKTLFVKGLVRSEDSLYHPMILFKNVRYNEPGVLFRNEGRVITFGHLSKEDTDVLVRCECLDFGFRFSWYDHLDHSLYGRKRKKYEGQGLWQANPMKMPGVCKHLIKMMESFIEAGILV
jgi:hypothetical protein